MEEKLTAEQVNLLELDIDIRISDLMWGLAELRSISPETAKLFLAAAWNRAIEDVVAGENPESLYNDNGYALPRRMVNPPAWEAKDFAPEEDDIMEYLEQCWSHRLSNEDRQFENMITYMRSAYGQAHVYAYLAHRANF